MPAFDQEFINSLFNNFDLVNDVWVVNGNDFVDGPALKEKVVENLTAGKFPGIYLFNINQGTFTGSELNRYLARHQIEILGIDALPYTAIEMLVENIPLSVKKIGVKSLHKKSVELILKKVKAHAATGRRIQIICGNEISDELKTRIAKFYQRPIVLIKPSSTQTVMANLGVKATPVSTEAKVVMDSKKRKRSPEAELDMEQIQALHIQSLNSLVQQLQIRYERENRARLDAEAKAEELYNTIQMLQQSLSEARVSLPVSPLSSYPLSPDSDTQHPPLSPMQTMPMLSLHSGNDTSFFLLPADHLLDMPLPEEDGHSPDDIATGLGFLVP